VFAAFAEYTITNGRMLKAFADVGQADNTLVVYIAGDTAPAAKAGRTACSTSTRTSRRAGDRSGHAEADRPVGRTETYPHMASGWAVGF